MVDCIRIGKLCRRWVGTKGGIRKDPMAGTNPGNQTVDAVVVVWERGYGTRYYGHVGSVSTGRTWWSGDHTDLRCAGI